MLKKLAKRINKELAQAEDYIEQAYLVKTKDSQTSELFANLATEEIDHARRLLKEGQRLVATKNVNNYDRMAKTEVEDTWHDNCKIIWEWEHRIATDCILKLEYKLSKYRSTP